MGRMLVGLISLVIFLYFAVTSHRLVDWEQRVIWMSFGVMPFLMFLCSFANLFLSPKAILLSSLVASTSLLASTALMSARDLGFLMLVITALLGAILIALFITHTETNQIQLMLWTFVGLNLTLAFFEITLDTSRLLPLGGISDSVASILWILILCWLSAASLHFLQQNN